MTTEKGHVPTPAQAELGASPKIRIPAEEQKQAYDKGFEVYTVRYVISSRNWAISVFIEGSSG
jgi:hypothetical protein